MLNPIAIALADRRVHQLGGEPMPTTIIRRKRSSRSSIGPYRRHELLTGKAMYPALGYDGYGDGFDTNMEHFISEEMRQDWICQSR